MKMRGYWVALVHPDGDVERCFLQASEDRPLTPEGIYEACEDWLFGDGDVIKITYGEKIVD